MNYIAVLLEYPREIIGTCTGISISCMELESRVQAWLSKRLREANPSDGNILGDFKARPTVDRISPVTTTSTSSLPASLNKPNSQLPEAPWDRFTGGGFAATDFDLAHDAMKAMDMLVRLELADITNASIESNGQIQQSNERRCRVVPLVIALERQRLNLHQAIGGSKESSADLTALWRSDPW
ncbi:unnamed protein product, partial [Protopolystoma xenopodis]